MKRMLLSISYWFKTSKGFSDQSLIQIHSPALAKWGDSINQSAR